MLLNRPQIKSKLLVNGNDLRAHAIICVGYFARYWARGTTRKPKDSLDVLVDQNLSDITTGFKISVGHQDEALQKKLLYD
jgi:hypothetical protein